MTDATDDVKETPPEPTLADRITELEAVVHTLATYSRAHEHGVVVAWLEKVGARLKATFQKEDKPNEAA